MRYEIADLLVEMSPGGRTAVQAEAYRVSAWDRPPDITIRVDRPSALACYPELKSGDQAEYLATGDRFALGLLRRGGLVLHAAAVEYRGRAVCFSAPPGVGKSTMAERWVRLFGAAVLNDDKPALRRLDGRWRAWGTPWAGTSGIQQNRSAPLEAVCFLFRGGENAAAPLTPAEALPLLLSQTPFYLKKEDMDRLLAAADRLLREVRFFRLSCRNDDTAARFARKFLFPD